MNLKNVARTDVFVEVIKSSNAGWESPQFPFFPTELVSLVQILYWKIDATPLG